MILRLSIWLRCLSATGLRQGGEWKSSPEAVQVKNVAASDHPGSAPRGPHSSELDSDTDICERRSAGATTWLTRDSQIVVDGTGASLMRDYVSRPPSASRLRRARDHARL